MSCRPNPCKCMLCAAAPVLAVLLCLLACAPQAHAASGKVYTCKVIASYKHPVTGEVEDSGGSSAQATGQAMVESCLTDKGQLEVTDGGKCYLTVRLGLVDHTKKQAFKVQKRGASTWKNPRISVIKTGSNKNGTTKDVCIELPAKRSILRVSMYVTSMGRSVVFYAYPSDLSAGKRKDMKAVVVTSASKKSDDGDADGGTDGAAAAGGESTSEASGSSASGAEESDSLQSTAVSQAQGLSLSTASELGQEASSVGLSRAACLAIAVCIVILAVLLVLCVRFLRSRRARAVPVDPRDDYAREYRSGAARADVPLYDAGDYFGPDELFGEGAGR